MDKIKIEIHDVSNGGNSRFSLNAGNPNNQQIQLSTEVISTTTGCGDSKQIRPLNAQCDEFGSIQRLISEDQDTFSNKRGSAPTFPADDLI